MMGNAAAVTDRSFAVPDGVNNGQYGIGIVIDFFGLAGKYSGFPVDFAYPAMTAVVPANIALIAGAKNADEARKFMAFTMSVPGQQLLFDPKISRLPILPYSQLKAPAGYPVPQEVAQRAKVQFDANLSESRYAVVISLFDQMVTFRLQGAAGGHARHPGGAQGPAGQAQCQGAGAAGAGARHRLLAAGGRSQCEGRAVPGAVPQEPARCGRVQGADGP